VARGTDVQTKHDTMLVDICTFNEGLDSQIEECIVGLNSYGMAFGDDDDDDDDEPAECADDDTECLLDQMHGSWEDEMSGLMDGGGEAKTGKGGGADEEEEGAAKEPKIAPWSSRSSPSGTFVRDPKTGEMRNIDE
jgi:hypothetical protein